MSIFIDKKYVMLVSRRLTNFKAKSEYLFNFRCPICGDSKKNKSRSRGYFFRRKNDMFFTCHNCNSNMSFGKFLSTYDPVLYNEYTMENFREKSFGREVSVDEDEFRTGIVMRKLSDNLIDLPSIDDLPSNHPSKKYILSRGIPQEHFSRLFYSDNFKDFVNKKAPKKAEKMIDGEERLIIPFWDENNNLLGFQGRALSKSDVKYITVKLDDANRKVYGLERVDFTKPVFVTEGPLDSLFLRNAIASMDATLQNIIPIVDVPDAEYYFIYDNEPRNRDVIRNVSKAIDMGLNVLIWPDSIGEKDINEMVLAGRNVEKLIEDHIYSGLRAKLEFERWKKI